MADLDFRDVRKGLRELGLTNVSQVIAHINFEAIGPVRGGPETLLGGLTSLAQLVMMPVFTYQCLVTPRVGPPENGLVYAEHQSENAEAEFFQSTLPAHPTLGVVAETLRHMKGAARSSHPVLSFTAVGAQAEAILGKQTLTDPWGPLEGLANAGGEVLVWGMDHTANVALHLAEQRAGRKAFVRWALTPKGVVECPNWPGCANGFEAIAKRAAAFTKTVPIGHTSASRLPLRDLLALAEELIRADAKALLCERPDCEYCKVIRQGTA